jgi:hypothetical protein
MWPIVVSTKGISCWFCSSSGLSLLFVIAIAQNPTHSAKESSAYGSVIRSALSSRIPLKKSAQRIKLDTFIRLPLNVTALFYKNLQKTGSASHGDHNRQVLLIDK